MTGVKTNDPKVYAITVPRSNNPARITGPIPSHNTWGRQDSHYLKESHSSSGGKRGKRAHDRFGGGARHGPLQTVQPEAALRHLPAPRSEEHTSELQSLRHLVCRLLLA